MKLSTTRLAALAALVQCCRAGLIPPELSSYFSASKQLVAIFNGTNITEAAQLIPTAETQSAPEIEISPSVADTPYIFLMVDPDYNSTVPTNVVLHTIVGNLTADSPSTGAKLLTSSVAPLAAYVGPEPPAGKPSHNYTMLLFAQPRNFSVPKVFEPFLPLNLSDVRTRVNFPLVDFVKQTSLGQPLAATYFRLNLTSSGASSTNPSSSSSATTSAATSTQTKSAATAISFSGWQLILSVAICYGML